MTQSLSTPFILPLPNKATSLVFVQPELLGLQRQWSDGKDRKKRDSTKNPIVRDLLFSHRLQKKTAAPLCYIVFILIGKSFGTGKTALCTTKNKIHFGGRNCSKDLSFLFLYGCLLKSPIGRGGEQLANQVDFTGTTYCFYLRKHPRSVHV